MDVPEKLLQFKFHFIFLSLFSILVALIVTYSSSVVTIFSYFWPLVVSTGLFFAAVVVFGRISPPEADCPGEKTGAELIDYVAGHPEMKVEDTHLPEKTVLPEKTLLLETDLHPL
ncbi:hypothetical protein MRB53_005503 [Persea americana]|uniref:Uncharacterized protein n=1 Tax=Persea americana TaxID=3435 RepID=A0ACC2MDP8_PERAE|nr:hypothetical protein MRB53_005503 [Persea americana]